MAGTQQGRRSRSSVSTELYSRGTFPPFHSGWSRCQPRLSVSVLLKSPSPSTVSSFKDSGHFLPHLFLNGQKITQKTDIILGYAQNCSQEKTGQVAGDFERTGQHCMTHSKCAGDFPDTRFPGETVRKHCIESVHDNWSAFFVCNDQRASISDLEHLF